MKQLMKGNDAAVRGAILGGATHFFGYPITPASEIAHAAAEFFPKAKGVFLQAESEVNAVNMLYGAAAAGARVMSASSGPGVSLMSEGISYIAACELPCVIVDVQRSGPGLGNIWPEQSDYDTVVTGGAHGNYKNIVFAPNSVQEMCDLTCRAFEIADQYRNPVFILADAHVGQMMEPVALPVKVQRGVRKEWALYGDAESRKNVITSIYMRKDQLHEINQRLAAKYARIQKELVDYEEHDTAEAEVLFVAYGICSRICLTAVRELRRSDLLAGMLRPKTLFPFPSEPLARLGGKVKKIIVVELSNGQMARDVRLAVGDRAPVELLNWMGGMVPSVPDIMSRLEREL
jgi:pyruvate/2-oxoacid:ferredoxin oxidoreductase alpha subunit